VAAPYRLQLDGEHAVAADRWSALGSPYEQALALVDSGDPAGARTALDVLDRLGAGAVASKVRQDLRLAGMAVVPGRRRARTRDNPHGLTARQVDVLRLLEEGLTNEQLARRLYISPKTADHHVSAILAKLQVPSRQHAVRAGRELGLLG
jgi:DNA-binding NarL/FixJ family response regulator